MTAIIVLQVFEISALGGVLSPGVVFHESEPAF